jgi:Protein of unknown function, DUF547
LRQARPAGMRALVFSLFLCPMILAAAPQAELWDVWTAHDPFSSELVDHSDWDRILREYLSVEGGSGITLFAYSRVDATDRAALRGYLDALERVRVDGLNRSEQMAYWINLYNALTVEVILDNWPVDSIRDINLGGGGLFARGPWDAPLAGIQGKEVSLNDIEHRILRPIWQDPRIHYAVNCASLGCPDLQMRAFTGDTLEQVLDEAAAAYINHPRGAEAVGRTLQLSSIYDWFIDDFGGTEEGVLHHIIRYADPGLAEKIAPFLQGKGRLRYRYNWRVNAG